MLAQVGLLKMRNLQSHRGQMKIAIHHESDNLAVTAACNKLFTMTQPLSNFLRLLVLTAQQLHFEVNLAHVPGKLNDWADGLSRGDESVIKLFSPEKRFGFCLHDLLIDEAIE